MTEFEFHSDVFYTNHLDTEKFARMLDDPSQCYKFYWLEAILTLASKTEDDLSFDDIINEMIYEAWYSVTEYHLKLGPTIKGKAENFLEQAIKILEEAESKKRLITKEDILQAISQNEKSLAKCKKNLENYVPYRILTPFYDETANEYKNRKQYQRLIAYMLGVQGKTCLFPYIIIPGKGLQKKIHVDQNWRKLILDHYIVIQGWIKLQKVKFLQSRNPGVPGIIYKLDMEADRARKLNNARTLWKCVVETSGQPIWDIYTEQELDVNKFDLDHFVPRSYVANDELWNLTPMDSQLNSSKNNRLPDWNKYFSRMANNQYYLYKMIFSYSVVRVQFEKCRRDNLNAKWAAETLFIKGNSESQFKYILEHNLKPLYEAALLQGYCCWEISEKSSNKK